MSVNQCIIPACKSVSCIDKRHFFTIPKDAIIITRWIRPIPRKSLVIEPIQVVVREYHFRDRDLLQRKIMTDVNGKVLAEALYTLPRQKKKAVPSILSNRPKCLPKNFPREEPLILNNPIKREIQNKNPGNEFMIDLPVNKESFSNNESNIQNYVKPFSFCTIQEISTALSSHNME